jgi:hypothetical protein
VIVLIANPPPLPPIEYELLPGPPPPHSRTLTVVIPAGIVHVALAPNGNILPVPYTPNIVALNALGEINKLLILKYSPIV